MRPPPAGTEKSRSPSANPWAMLIARLYEGQLVGVVTDDLKDEGVALAVVTAKREQQAITVIELRPIILARSKLLGRGGVEVVVLDHGDELAVLRLHAGGVQIAVFQGFS